MERYYALFAVYLLWRELLTNLINLLEENNFLLALIVREAVLNPLFYTRLCVRIGILPMSIHNEDKRADK